jgi:hypothetical protein
LQHLLTDAAANTWLSKYLLAGSIYYLQDMVMGNGPQAYIVTALQYLSIETTNVTRIDYASFTARAAAIQPTPYGPAVIASGGFGSHNDPQDHTSQIATAYPGEYICAAQFRKLDVRFRLQDVALPATIPLRPLKDLRDGTSGEKTEESSPAREEIQRPVGVVWESDSMGEEIKEDYVAGTDPDDYGKINWRTIKIQMGVLG